MSTTEAHYFEIFPWNSNFETGITVIDDQHKELVHILNQLAAHLANLSDSITLNEYFDKLAHYANYHFETEEKIWRKHFSNDTWFEQHETTHHTFIADVLQLKESNENASLDETIYKIVSFLSHWLAYHILDSDKRMAMCLLALQEGITLKEAKIKANEQMNGSMKVLVDTVLTMYDSLSIRTLDLMREKALRKQAEEALNKSEQRWEFILEGGAENVWDWDIENNSVTFSEESLSLTLLDIVGNASQQKGNSHIHKKDLPRVEAEFKAHLEGKTEFYSNKHRVLHSNGSWSWVLSRGKVVSRDAQGKALRMVGTHSDITERELASIIYQNSSQAMLISDVNNIVISINPAFTNITGYAPSEIIGKKPQLLASGKHDALFYAKMWESITHKGYWNGEIWNRRKNGEIFPETLSINTVKNKAGELDHYVALFYDITDKKRADALILEQANYDPLTKLQNRRMFLSRLEQEIQRSNRSSIPFALLFVDLDHFKEVNDSLGHEMGDKLLIEVAERIKHHVRESDLISRLGGDEFTIIFPDLFKTLRLDRITQSIIDSLNKPFQLGLNQVYISASIGITLFPNDAHDSTSLLKNADQAMYLAKRQGRNCYSYFTPSMQDAAQKRQKIINDMHIALKEDQFELYYQPIVDLKSGDILKAEALIRWNHPQKGVVFPDEFIAIAEESGLINSIGDWVYKKAMKQAKIWNRTYNLNFKMSINKSPVQFRSTSQLQEWCDYLEELELNGTHCVVEITENILMENEHHIVDKLIALRDAGIEISLDDFGTGYSSLSYLQKFDIDYIKIDKSFIQLLSEGNQTSILCEAMIVMAHKMGIKVIAEGIETPEQKRILSDFQCDYGQGYLFSKAVTASEFERLLKVH